MIMIAIMIRPTNTTNHSNHSLEAHVESFRIAERRANTVVVIRGSMNNIMEGTNCLVTNATSRHSTRSLSCCQLIILLSDFGHSYPSIQHILTAFEQLNSADTVTDSRYLLT